ncbi:MAG: YkgJ family cysteine cluster protein [Desulfopila sp.]|jgi:Fe-S-cluster containining protein|nr:YkgJ family cysteine cluster protein [Desulfopila sp.]
MTYWNFWKNIAQNSLFQREKLCIQHRQDGDSHPPLQVANLPESSISAISEFANTSTFIDRKLTRPSQCQKCGACCAFFRVSFPGNETDSNVHGCIPVDLTVFCDEARRSMKGTETRNPRCIALHGQVGTQVSCTIYLNRPSCCRTFFQSWENGTGNTLCDKARAVFGMQPFSQF